MTRRGLIAAVAVLPALGYRLPAQAIGSLPDRSPFADLQDGHRIGVTAGYMATGRDPAGVGPKGGPVVGLRYDLLAGGPAYLTGRLFTMNSTRDVLDYTKKASQRVVGTQACRIIGADAGLTFALTGERSWHSLQPLAHSGIGFASGLADRADVSGYKFQGAFTFSYGLGARYVTGKNSELRADIAWYYWQLKYPETYRSTQGDTISIRPSGSLSPWTGNRAVAVSWTWGIFR